MKYTVHAIQRMARREIRKEWVEAVIANPAYVVKHPSGRWILRGKPVRRTWLMVVLSPETDWVITVRFDERFKPQ